MTVYAAFDPSALFAGDFQHVSRTLTVLTGQNASGTLLPRGTLLGRVTTSDKYIPCVKTASDGSQTPVAILAVDTDTSAADSVAPAYFVGEFAFEKMTVDASWTLTTLQNALRQSSSMLFIRSLGAVA
jgi:hypothetical protein